jgi:hypothetical protein
MANKNVASSIVNLNLQTKNKRKIPPSVTIANEIARLERANSYIANEPDKIHFTQRNEARIESLSTSLEAAKQKEQKSSAS